MLLLGLIFPVLINAQIVSNGDFSNGLTGGWSFQDLETANATSSITDGVFHASITNGGTEVWHIQLSQGGISLQQDSTYLVSFKASADSQRTINASVGLNQDPWTYYGGTQALLADSMQIFEFTFTLRSSSNSNARVVFDMGKSAINVHLDDISIEKIKAVPLKGMKETPFTKGVNVTNWFQVASPQQIDFTKYTKQDFINIKSLGADVIRLPINLHSMVGAAPDYALDSLFLFFLDQVVDWAEELELHLILDNHTFDPAVDTDPDVGDILVPVWRQMAAHYADRSEFIYFEVLNEPHGIAESTWNAIQQRVIDAIREVDQTHTIVVGGANFNSFNSLQYIPEFADTNLIYTYHFYDPFLLTHQGASWTDPSLVSLSGIPFPYNAAAMPGVPSDLQGTWVESSFTDYATDGTAERVQELLDIAINFAEQRGVAIFCGELGVYNLNSENESRVNWHTIVNAYLTERGVSWTNWDYHGGFGVFEKNSNGLFDHDLNVPILEAMGFTVPPQTEYVMKPDSTGFEVYTDFSAKGVSSGGSGNPLSFYDKSDPYDGEFAIHWTGANQYQAINFDFQPNKDLSEIIDWTLLKMYVKGDTPGATFDLRFIDTKTGSDDHPWRMFYRVSSSEVPFDGEWNLLEIPLSSFVEMGSYDNNQWFDPVGEFDWSAVDNFNIVAEEAALGEANFWFDEIEIVSGLIDDIEEEFTPVSFTLNQNYPNPFNPNTVISYQLPASSTVQLSVFDNLGRKVTTLVDSRQQSGSHSVKFDGSALASGIYFYELRVGDNIQRKSMMMIK